MDQNQNTDHLTNLTKLLKYVEEKARKNKFKNNSII